MVTVPAAPAAPDALTYPLAGHAPEPGEVVEVAPGIGWWRVPMWGPLKHVNGYLLDDDDGAVAVVDTGINSDDSVAAWRTILAGPLGGRALSQVICTHYHPDHTGLAGWLCRKFQVPLVMTRAEWLTFRMLAADARPEVPDEVIDFWRGAGWNEAQIARGSEGGWSRFARMVARPPMGFRRIREGETIAIGGHDWRVVTGNGHSPDHACLLDEQRRLLIAGDQVLPRISSNISLSAGEPEGDPLGDWLASIAKLKTLDDDLLVLPGHGDPFRGLHARLDQLADEHAQRLEKLHAWLAEPRRGVDCFSVLFRRPVGDDVLGIATGEALAHLRRLELAGLARRETIDGIWWYRAA